MESFGTLKIMKLSDHVELGTKASEPKKKRKPGKSSLKIKNNVVEMKPLKPLKPLLGHTLSESVVETCHRTYEVNQACKQITSEPYRVWVLRAKHPHSLCHAANSEH